MAVCLEETLYVVPRWHMLGPKNLGTLVFRFLKLWDHVRRKKRAYYLDESLCQIWSFGVKRSGLMNYSKNLGALSQTVRPYVGQ